MLRPDAPQHDGSRAADAASQRRDWLAGAARGLSDTSSTTSSPSATSAWLLQSLVKRELADLPLPGRGQTLARWQALSDVASHDLSLAKLFEGHTDALAILRELGSAAPPPGSVWGTWCAEAPQAKVLIEGELPPRMRAGTAASATVRLRGRKAWCSGAGHCTHGLLTVWLAEGDAPWLARVAMDQPGVRVEPGAWNAIGMPGSAAVDVVFEGAQAELVGRAGDYLSRPGFWQGGAGVAACWYGGSLTIANALRSAASSPFRLAALGRVDMALHQTAALLREAATWIDDHPAEDASALALRVRLSAETTASAVLDETGRALGAAPFCLNARFARMAADLPVFIRQSHAERDFAALGERVAAQEVAWAL